MIAIRFDDLVLAAARKAQANNPQVPLPELADGIVQSLEMAAAEGLVRLFGSWVWVIL